MRQRLLNVGFMGVGGWVVGGPNPPAGDAELEKTSNACGVETTCQAMAEHVNATNWSVIDHDSQRANRADFHLVFTRPPEIAR
jgi:hypothetical protein